MKKAFWTIGVLFLTVNAGYAAPITVAWAPQVSSSGLPTDFDDATMTFPGFVADTLVSINDTGNQGSFSDGYVHSHGGAVNYNIDILLDGIWTTVIAGVVPNAGTIFLADVGLSASFGSGVVSGIRMLSNPDQGVSYHAWDNASFTFDTRAVPEPASMLLLGSGLLGVATAVRRRRKS